MYPSWYTTGDECEWPSGGVDLGGMAQGGGSWEPQDDYNCYEGSPYSGEIMGDMADLSLDYAMDDCEEYWDYRAGRFSLEEAYDRGLINEFGGEYPADTRMPYASSRSASISTVKRSNIKCRNCGDTNVYWHQHNNGSWCLFDNDTKKGHVCKEKDSTDEKIGILDEISELKKRLSDLETKLRAK